MISASVNSPVAPGTTAWEHISHGFQASTVVQYCSSLPFNIVSGVNSLQRTANTTFGPGSYPSNPLPSFNTVTAVGDPRTLQFGVRLTF